MIVGKVMEAVFAKMSPIKKQKVQYNPVEDQMLVAFGNALISGKSNKASSLSTKESTKSTKSTKSMQRSSSSSSSASSNSSNSSNSSEWETG